MEASPAPQANHIKISDHTIQFDGQTMFRAQWSNTSLRLNILPCWLIFLTETELNSLNGLLSKLTPFPQQFGFTYYLEGGLERDETFSKVMRSIRLIAAMVDEPWHMDHLYDMYKMDNDSFYELSFSSEAMCMAAQIMLMGI